MPRVNMVACPKCGTLNSDKKTACYQCQTALRAAPAGKPRRQAGGLSARQREQPGREKATRTAKHQGAAPPSALQGATLRQRAQFYRQMHSLLHSGVGLGLALGYARDNCPHRLRAIVNRMSEHVERGGRMSDMMREYYNIFPGWEVSIVQAAERGGTLPEAMASIADTIETEWDLRARSFAATIHLQATLVVFVIVLLVVLNVQGANGLSEVLARLAMAFYQFVALVVAVLAIALGWRYFTRSRAGGTVLARLTPRLPLIGPILKAMAQMRFVLVLGALWKAGVAPMEALESATAATGNVLLQRQIGENLRLLGQGERLSDIIGPTGYLPVEAMHLLHTGEHSGTISEALRQIADYLQIDLRGRVQTLPAKLQLLMYAVIVPLVFFFLLAFYSGYFAEYKDILGE